MKANHCLASNFSAVYKTLRFVTVPPSANHRFLFWVQWIHFTSSRPSYWYPFQYHPPMYASVWQEVFFIQW